MCIRDRIGLAHDFEVNGIQRKLGQDAGKDGRNAHKCVQDTGDEAGQQLSRIHIYIYFNTDQFATFCQNAAINLFVLMTNYSFRYIAGRVQSGLSNGLSLSLIHI